MNIKPINEQVNQKSSLPCIVTILTIEDSEKIEKEIAQLKKDIFKEDPVHKQKIDSLIAEINANSDLDFNESKKSTKKSKKPKTIVEMTDGQIRFKNEFYAIFTTKKKFPKEIIKLIDKEILHDEYGIDKMTREEERSIDNYFVNRYNIKDLILQLLSENKQRIQNKYLTNIDADKLK